MELLYLIDRTLTRLVQKCFIYMQRKLYIPFGVQCAFSSLVTNAVIFSLFKPLWNLASTDGLGDAVLFFLFYLGGSVIACKIARRMLFHLHNFFDSQGATANDKLYSDGYDAWGCVIIGSIFLILGRYFHALPCAMSLVMTGFCLWMVSAYAEFINRKKGSTRKKKPVASAALDKLLKVYRRMTAPSPIPEAG